MNKKYWLVRGIIAGVIVWASSMFFLIDGRYNNGMVPGLYQLDWFGRDSLFSLLFFVISFQLFFSRKTYWLKGGIMGLIVSVVLSLRIFFQPACDFFLQDGTSGCSVTPDATYFLVILIYFFVGALIGWLYWKIRNKKPK